MTISDFWILFLICTNFIFALGNVALFLINKELRREIEKRQAWQDRDLQKWRERI